MLLIGKDTLKALEARFDLQNNIGIFPGAGDLHGKVFARESRRTFDGSTVARFVMGVSRFVCPIRVSWTSRFFCEREK